MFEVQLGNTGAIEYEFVTLTNLNVILENILGKYPEQLVFGHDGLCIEQGHVDPLNTQGDG